jgi:hypothetical protein
MAVAFFFSVHAASQLCKLGRGADCSFAPDTNVSFSSHGSRLANLMFSTSIIPCDNNKEGFAMAVRPLKDAPLKEFLFDNGAMEVLRDATFFKSIAKSSDHHHDEEGSHTPPDYTMEDSSSNSNTNTNTNKDG